MDNSSLHLESSAPGLALFGFSLRACIQDDCEEVEGARHGTESVPARRFDYSHPTRNNLRAVYLGKFIHQTHNFSMVDAGLHRIATLEPQLQTNLGYREEWTASLSTTDPPTATTP